MQHRGSFSPKSSRWLYVIVTYGTAYSKNKFQMLVVHVLLQTPYPASFINHSSFMSHSVLALVQTRVLVDLNGRVDLANEPPTSKVANRACKNEEQE
jgi:hypothetical protein